MPLSRRAVSASLPVAHISAVAPPPTVASPRSTDATGSSRPTALPNGELRRAIGAPDTATPLAPSALTPPLPGVAASSAGARFLAALHEAPVDPVRPVPARFAPLARAIAGPRPVAVRSGPSTTRALGRAGKRAATVGNVVHLPSSPVTAPPSAEVFAHELVHAARPSPVPRFFDDDRHSPEEDLARAAGSLMRAVQPPTDAGQGPAEFIRRQAAADSRTPTFGTAGLAVGASGGLMSALAGATPATPAANSPAAKDDEIRRSRAGRAAAERRKTRPATTTSSSPSSSAARSSSSSLPSPTTTIFRSVAGSGIVRRELDSSGAPGSSIFGSNGAIAGAGNHDDGNTPVAGGLLPSLGAAGQSANKVSNSNSPAENELIERIIDAIEERVIAELERRGRRHHPGVF